MPHAALFSWSMVASFPFNPGYIVIAVIGLALAWSWRRGRREREASDERAARHEPLDRESKGPR